MNHELKVWQEEVVRSERNLVIELPNIPGGRGIQESTLQYKERVLTRIKNAEERYLFALAKVASLKGENEKAI